jgi:hypothetical protein
VFKSKQRSAAARRTGRYTRPSQMRRRALSGSSPACLLLSVAVSKRGALDLVSVDSVGASVVLNGASTLNSGSPIDEGVLVDLERAIGVARVLNSGSSNAANGATSSSSTTTGSTTTTSSSSSTTTTTIGSSTTGSSTATTCSVVVIVVGLLAAVVLALVVLALVVLALVILALVILALAAAVLLLTTTVLLLTTAILLLTATVLLLAATVLLLAAAVLLLVATLVLVSVVVVVIVVLLTATVLLLATVVLLATTSTSISTSTSTSISASTSTSTSTSTTASVVTLADGEVLAILLRATLGDRHEDGLMVGSRRHGADAVVTGGKSTGDISLNETLAVAGIVDALEEYELLGVEGGLRVKGVASVLDGDVGVANDPAVSTELSGTAVVGARGVGESAEVEVGNVELDGEGLANGEVLEVPGRGNNSGDHVLHGGNVTHNWQV